MAMVIAQRARLRRIGVAVETTADAGATVGQAGSCSYVVGVRYSELAGVSGVAGVEGTAAAGVSILVVGSGSAGDRSPVGSRFSFIVVPSPCSPSARQRPEGRSLAAA